MTLINLNGVGNSRMSQINPPDGTEKPEIAEARLDAFRRYAIEWERAGGAKHPMFTDKTFQGVAARACGMTKKERDTLHAFGAAEYKRGRLTDADLREWRDHVNTWDIAEESRARFTWTDEAKAIADKPRHRFDQTDYDFRPLMKDRKDEKPEMRHARLAAVTHYEYARESKRFRYLMALESTKEKLRGTLHELVMDSPCGCEAEEDIMAIERRIGGWVCFLVFLARELAADVPFQDVEAGRIDEAMRHVGAFTHYLTNAPVRLAYHAEITREVTEHILLSKTTPVPVREVIPYKTREVFATTQDTMHSVRVKEAVPQRQRAITDGAEFIALRLAWGFATETDMVNSFAAMLKNMKRPKAIQKRNNPRGSSLIDYFDAKLRQLAVMRLCYHCSPAKAVDEARRLNLRDGESSDVRKIARRANAWFQEGFPLGEGAQWFKGGAGRGRPRKKGR